MLFYLSIVFLSFILLVGLGYFIECLDNPYADKKKYCKEKIKETNIFRFLFYSLFIIAFVLFYFIIMLFMIALILILFTILLPVLILLWFYLGIKIIFIKVFLRIKNETKKDIIDAEIEN